MIEWPEAGAARAARWRSPGGAPAPRRVLAAGDITDYPGKVRLIAVGFGEVATAVNNAAVMIDPDAHVFPGHSSEDS